LQYLVNFLCVVIGDGFAFGRPPINNGSHNNQPKTGIHDGGEYGEDVRRLGGAGIILGTLEVGRLIKTKINH
jgi:hypothetical protein